MKRLRRRGFYLEQLRPLKKMGGVFAFMALFLIGFLCGVLLVRNGFDDSLSITDLVQNFLFQRKSQNVFSTIVASLTGMIPFWLGAFFLGFSSIGAPLVCAVPWVRGIGLGLIAGFLYHKYCWQGVALFSLVLAPSVLLSTIALVGACLYAYRFSKGLFGVVRPTGPYTDLWPVCRQFLKVQGFSLGGLILSAVIDGMFCSLFLRFFTLG